MTLRRRARAARVSQIVWRLFTAAGVITLAGCAPDGQPSLNAAQPRGASVAFESIDGPPPDKFRKLVGDLNEEAQARRLAVAARESPSAYRVRGYLAAETAKKKTTISWVWDVFDREQHRALRISGEENIKGRHHNAWVIADDVVLHRIARSSMDQLAAFLASPAVAPGTPAPAAPTATPIAMLGQHDTSPEAAGISRIVQPQTDPLSETDGAGETVSAPMLRPRPSSASAAPAMSAHATFTLATAGR